MSTGFVIRERYFSAHDLARELDTGDNADAVRALVTDLAERIGMAAPGRRYTVEPHGAPGEYVIYLDRTAEWHGLNLATLIDVDCGKLTAGWLEHKLNAPDPVPGESEDNPAPDDRPLAVGDRVEITGLDSSGGNAGMVGREGRARHIFSDGTVRVVIADQFGSEMGIGYWPGSLRLLPAEDGVGDAERDGWYSRQWFARRTRAGGGWTIASRDEESVLASSLDIGAAREIADELDRMHAEIERLTAELEGQRGDKEAAEAAFDRQFDLTDKIRSVLARMEVERDAAQDMLMDVAAGVRALDAVVEQATAWEKGL